MTPSLPTPRILAAVLLTAFSVATQAACPSGPGNACPIKGPAGVVLFDQCFASNPLDPKPTSVGRDACRALADAERLGAALGTNATRAAQDASRQFDTQVRNAGIVVSREVQDTVRDTRRFFGEAQRQVLTLANDQQCGASSTLKNVQSALGDDWSKLQTLLATAPKIAQLFEIVGQIGGKSTQLSQSIATVGADISKGGAQAQSEFAKLKSAADSFDRSVKEVMGNNSAGTITQTVADLTRLGTTLGTAGACASSVAAGIASAGSGSAAAGGGGAACAPSEGVGCVIAAAGGAVGGVGTALSAALAGPSCTAMTAAAANLASDVAALERLINNTAGAINGVLKAAAQLQDAAQSLARLAETLPRESEGNLRRVAQDINGIGAMFASASVTIERDLLPTYTRVTQQVLTDTVGRVQLAYTCFDKAVDVAADLGMDFADLLREHNVGAQAVLDAAQAASDLQARIARAGDAAGDAARREWDKLKTEDRRLHRAIWGVDQGVTDLPRTGAHLASLATNPARVADIADDLGKMIGKETQLVVTAVAAASDALLAPDKLKPFTDKHELARSQSRKTAVEIAKAKARANAVAKARQTKVTLAAVNVRPPQTAAVTRIVVPDLRVAVKLGNKAGG